jgi:hypothetical protein
VLNLGIFVKFSMYCVMMFLNCFPPSGLEVEAVKILEKMSRIETRSGGSRDVLHNAGS